MQTRAHPARKASPGDIGPLLRQWREIRGKSQLALSMDAGVSQRHVSFVESGRSAPSQALLLTLARALDMPLRERNRLLLAGGFAPAYADEPYDGTTMDAIGHALERMLAQHEPFPAVVLDRHWNVIRTNDAAPRFFGAFVDLAAWPRPRNLLHLMFDPAGMRPFIANWEDTSQALLERVRREAIGGVLDRASETLIRELLAYGDLAPDAGVSSSGTPPAAPTPVIPITFDLNGTQLSYFSMVTTVGTPSAVSAQELRIECMYPLDNETEKQHRAWMAQQLPAR